MSEFVEYHGKRAQEHQQSVDDLVPQGFRILSLSVYGGSVNARYAGVWVKRGGPRFIGFHGQRPQEYQALFDNLSPEGYIPTILSATGTGADAIFAGVFEQLKLPAFWARHDIDAATFLRENETAWNNDLILRTATAYGAENDVRYAGVWVPNPDKVDWVCWLPESGADYQRHFEAGVELPMRLGLVDTSDDLRYLCLFRDDSVGPWHARHGLTPGEYQSEFDAQKEKGFYPICVQGCGDASSIRYAAIFAQRDVPLVRVWRVTGTASSQFAAFDEKMKQFMQNRGVRAAALAIAKNGAPMFSRGYTWAEESYPTTQPGSLFRLASVSKAFTCAAIGQLNLAPTTTVFPFLGIRWPALSGQTPDPNINQITVQQLVEHKGGWDRGVSRFDPVFASRSISKKFGLHTFPSKQQVAHYMYGEPLQFSPGSKSVYSNIGYVLLGLVVERASGQSFTDFVRQSILAPLGVTDVFLALTLKTQRHAGEVFYEDRGIGLTAVEPDSNALVPSAYGGFITETMDAGGGLIASAPAVARFVHSHAVWGVGGRSPGAARTGTMAGTRTRAGSRPNGYDYAFLFNTRTELEDMEGDVAIVDVFGEELEKMLDDMS
jgi:CubicO group peptidase (beta-lactamase class C family)